MTLRLAKLGYRGLRAIASLSLARSAGGETVEVSRLGPLQAIEGLGIRDEGVGYLAGACAVP